jgi:hypothetical protein
MQLRWCFPVKQVLLAQNTSFGDEGGGEPGVPISSTAVKPQRQWHLNHIEDRSGRVEHCKASSTKKKTYWISNKSFFVSVITLGAFESYYSQEKEGIAHVYHAFII